MGDRMNGSISAADNNKIMSSPDGLLDKVGEPLRFSDRIGGIQGKAAIDQLLLGLAVVFSALT
jgi:hypothetical protein